MSEKQTFEEIIKKAEHYAKIKQWNNALAFYDKAVTLSPGNIDLYYNRAQIRHILCNYPGALEDYNKILELDPGCSKALVQRGILWGFHLRDPQKGIVDFGKVNKDDPIKAIACLYAGILFYNKKDYDNAEKEYEKALKRDPGIGAIHFFRALLYKETGKYLKALDDYKTALKKGFTCSELFFDLGLVYAKFRNFHQTRQEFLHSHTEVPYRISGFQDYHCNYFNDGRQAVTENIYPDHAKIENLSYYLERGFVRYANYYFRHVCKDCKECIPLRVVVNDFLVSRSLKRTLKRNSDLRIVIPDSPVVDPVRANLFEKYYKNKHKSDSPKSPEEEIAFRHLGFKNSYELDFYLDDTLVAVHIVDAGSDALYAAYLYYDTNYMKRRLGVFCIAKAIEFAAKLGKSFYYMGWYIEKLPIMAYKKQFRPNQLLIDGVWKDFCGKV
ncbi:MAG: arginyltransferase [Spirochaetales bacterium]|nr:arginyltransferase [Spirochaetales bacterium]